MSFFSDERASELRELFFESATELLQALNDDGISIVLVTHESDIAAHARRVIVLRDGLIVEDRMQEPVVLARPVGAAS